MRSRPPPISRIPIGGIIPDPQRSGALIEINLGQNHTVEGFALKLWETHAAPLAERIIAHLGLRGVDIEAGDYFPAKRPIGENPKRWRRYQPPLPEGLTTREAAIEFLQARGYQAGARDWAAEESIWAYNSSFDCDGIEMFGEHVYLFPDHEPNGRWCVMDMVVESFWDLTTALQAAMDCLDGCLLLRLEEGVIG